MIAASGGGSAWISMAPWITETIKFCLPFRFFPTNSTRDWEKGGGQEPLN